MDTLRLSAIAMWHLTYMGRKCGGELLYTCELSFKLQKAEYFVSYILSGHASSSMQRRAIHDKNITGLLYPHARGNSSKYAFTVYASNPEGACGAWWIIGKEHPVTLAEMSKATEAALSNESYPPNVSCTIIGTGNFADLTIETIAQRLLLFVEDAKANGTQTKFKTKRYLASDKKRASRSGA
jgi:hypothetical protein